MLIIPEVLLAACLVGNTAIGDTTLTELVPVPGIVNPEYTITIDTIIDPLAYGIPVTSFCDQGRIGATAMFVDEGENEHWRIILLLHDRLVVLEEHEPKIREVMFDFNPTRLFWSASGSYAATSSSEHQDGLVDIRYLNLLEDSEGSFQASLEALRSYRIMNSGTWVQEHCNASGSCFLAMDGANGAVDSITDEEISIQDCFFPSHEDILVVQAEPSSWRSGYRYSRILTAQDAEFDTLWVVDTGRYTPTPAISSHGRYLIYGSRDGILCFNGRSGEPLFTGLLPFEVKAPTISPGEVAWVAGARAGGTSPSRFILGWFDSTRPMSTIFNGSNDYWGDEKIGGVSDTGRTVIWKPDERSYYSAAWMQLLDPEGHEIWNSGTISMLEGVHQPVFNEGEHIILALSASGDRLLFSDYRSIYVLSIQ